jgi:ABC-type polysaccharide/polyol phosphate export permease
MFRAPDNKSKTRSVFTMSEVVYHSIVRNLRSGHRNAVAVMVLTTLQSLVMIGGFLLMFLLLGVRTAPIRGDFIIFIMSGIFMYMTHTKTVAAVAGAGNPLGPLMQHAPMNTIISIMASAVAVLYRQLFSIAVILLVYHVLINPVTIHEPVGVLGIVLLAWFFGIAVGMVFLALNPWIPDFAGLLRAFYIRINMIASGKMFVVNALPATTVAMFDWNPLFHIIDQSRGHFFLHYNPHVTNIAYPIYVSLVLIMIGLMGEFYTRKHISVSWYASR